MSKATKTTSTKDQVEVLLELAQAHLARTMADPESKGSERAAALAQVKAILRERARLRGELEITEATLVRSPAWKRVQSLIADALKPHPDALKAFVEAMRKAEEANGS
ncbi:MAG TPA: hypothetical protein VGH28_10470 [Polyangiaceae bacterium]|jgi:formate dehydrogenase maturation protein FdhE